MMAFPAAQDLMPFTRDLFTMAMIRGDSSIDDAFLSRASTTYTPPPAHQYECLLAISETRLFLTLPPASGAEGRFDIKLREC